MTTEPTRRLLPDECKAAYAKTGLGVTEREYLGKEGNCGCPMGALYIAETRLNPKRTTGMDALDWCNKQFGVVYHREFTRAFDYAGSQWAYEAPGDQQRANEGHADGLACRQAMLPEVT